MHLGNIVAASSPLLVCTAMRVMYSLVLHAVQAGRSFVVLAAIALLLYGSVPLAVVLMAAMTLNMLLAACMGVFIPLIRLRLGGDPALGSSVLITAITDSGGFFIFLGLATVFLL